jgi:hypothetical protein
MADHKTISYALKRMYHQCQPLGKGQHEKSDPDMTNRPTVEQHMPQAASLDGAMRLAGVRRP